jgi:hypothetical protein
MAEQTVQEITNELTKAIDAVIASKKTFDMATLAVTDASNKHQQAIERANVLRDMLTNKLNDALGEAQTNVRQSR